MNNWARYSRGGVHRYRPCHHAGKCQRIGREHHEHARSGTFEGKTLVRDSVPHELMTGEGPERRGGRRHRFRPHRGTWADFPLARPQSRRPGPILCRATRPTALSVFMHEFGHVLGDDRLRRTGRYADRRDGIGLRQPDYLHGQTMPSFLARRRPSGLRRPRPTLQPEPGKPRTTTRTTGARHRMASTANLMEGNTFFFNGTRYEHRADRSGHHAGHGTVGRRPMADRLEHR